MSNAAIGGNTQGTLLKWIGGITVLLVIVAAMVCYNGFMKKSADC